MGNADGSPMQCVFARCVECRKERDELRATVAKLETVQNELDVLIGIFKDAKTLIELTKERNGLRVLLSAAIDLAEEVLAFTDMSQSGYDDFDARIAVIKKAKGE